MEKEIPSLQVLLITTAEMFFLWDIKVLHREELASVTIQHLAINITNGRKFNIMVKSHTIMVEKEKVLVHMNITMILYLSQLRSDN